ncbi:Flp family type IVb pilin [Halomonas sp. C05BenzN]|uniref:Flp family type IVb pilin n=1 Tax=Halomonas sp. C05BenzN TaxID=3411041 RepID=UPI003B936F96
MSKLMQGIERFWREEEGTEVVEWALVGGLIVAVGAAIFVVIGENARQFLASINDALVAGGGDSATPAE